MVYVGGGWRVWVHAPGFRVFVRWVEFDAVLGSLGGLAWVLDGGLGVGGVGRGAGSWAWGVGSGVDGTG